MDKKRYFYFDIETTRKYKTFKDFEDNDERGAALFKKKWKSKNVDMALEEWYKDQAGLLPEYGKVLCVSYGFYKADGSFACGSVFSDNEEELMKNCKTVFDRVSVLGLTLCGYNIKGFDMPYLFKKFLSYHIVPPQVLNTYNKKPWDVVVLDLQDLWKATSMHACTFDEFAYSIGVASPKTEMCGSEVGDAYFDKRLTDIKNYCEKDVKCCAECVEAIEELF